MRQNKKGVLILILVLLAIFTPLAIWGVIANMMGVNIPEPENLNHDFKFNGKLYFYNNSDELLATYKCENTICDYAKYSIDDDKYVIKYYKEENIDNEDNTQNTQIINNRYVFILDGITIKLFDLKSSTVFANLKAIKNYNIGIDNDYYIVEDVNNNWGVISLKDAAAFVIKCEYEYIGLHNEINQETKHLKSDLFVVKNYEGWKLINSNNVKQSSDFLNEIYDYNKDYVITKKNKIYYLNNINGGNSVQLSYKKVDLVGDYLAVVDENNDFYIIDPKNDNKLTEEFDVNDDDQLRCEILDKAIFIFINDAFKARVELD